MLRTTFYYLCYRWNATHLLTGDKDLLDIKIFGATKLLPLQSTFHFNNDIFFEAYRGCGAGIFEAAGDREENRPAHGGCNCCAWMKTRWTNLQALYRVCGTG